MASQTIAAHVQSLWQDYDPAKDLPYLATSVKDKYFRDANLVFSTFRAAWVPPAGASGPVADSSNSSPVSQICRTSYLTLRP